jgi:hypothetical protein
MSRAVFKLEVVPIEDDHRVDITWNQGGIDVKVGATLNEVRDFFTRKREPRRRPLKPTDSPVKVVGPDSY